MPRRYICAAIQRSMCAKQPRHGIHVLQRQQVIAEGFEAPPSAQFEASRS